MKFLAFDSAFLVALLVLALLSLPVSGQDNECRAVQATVAPRMDGRLDDPCWQNIPRITQFTQRELQVG
ncbi:MAG: hypothetical protein ACKO7X_01720 [Bacteroidota bacterium]